MEVKSVIVSALLMSLVLGQIQVEATKTCCPSSTSRQIYDACHSVGFSSDRCASYSGCKIISGNTCDSGWTNDILENTGENAVNEYCKLGCASSVCGAISALNNYDASEVVNGAVEKCTKTCSAFCTKGSKTAVETA